MNDRGSPQQLSSRSRCQDSGVSLLDALHESRRLQAMRAINNYRHLLGKAEADEIRRATEEFTRERVSIRSFCGVWRPRFPWISLLMKRMRAWKQGRSIIVSQDQPGCIGRNAQKGTTNMSAKFSFHKTPPQPGRKSQLIDRSAQNSTSGQMSFWTTVVVITILVGFAVLHVIGFTLIKEASDQPTVGPAHMYPTD
jgi:hypothetical protein